MIRFMMLPMLFLASAVEPVTWQLKGPASQRSEQLSCHAHLRGGW